MDDERAAELLAAERRRIERALAALGKDHRGAVEADAQELSGRDQHPADEATDLYEEERDEGALEDLQRDLEAVERAEARLAEGKFGLSVESGEPIPDERLEALPTAERTVDEETRARRSP